MKRQWILVLIALLLVMVPMGGLCEAWYSPTYFASDKEALEVLQSLKGSFFGSSNYAKQTVEIDRYGLRLFSEYLGTKKVWNTWEMYYMTVPDIRTENAILDFKSINFLIIAGNAVTPGVNPWCVTVDNTVATTFCVKNEATAVRFADAVATLAAAAGAKWSMVGGYLLPSSEKWFRDKLNWKKLTGAVLKTVNPGGPFDRAGIQAEDIVLTFGGKEVTNAATLWKLQQDLISMPAYEIRVAVTVFRKGATLDKEVVYYNHSVKAGQIRRLIDQPAGPAAPSQPEKPKLGVQIRSLTDEDVKTMNLTSPAGVLVTGVDSNSTAQRMNLMVNDIIIELNGIALKNTEHLKEIMSASPISKMKVKRGEAMVDLTVPVSI